MVVLAQGGGLLLLKLLAVLAIPIGFICAIVALRNIADLREIVSRLETSLRLLKDRIGAAEVSLRKLARGEAPEKEAAERRRWGPDAKPEVEPPPTPVRAGRPVQGA